MRIIIDTNIPIVANRRDSPQASFQCIKACEQLIQEIIDGGKYVLVLDNKRQITNEYMRKLNLSGRPGIGDAFLNWVMRNRWNPECCEQVEITLKADAQHASDFTAFPTDPRLAKFDLSDRKFVAVALTHPAKPPIYNAVDTDWRDFQEALEAHGVKVIFLCPEAMLPNSKGET